MEGSIAMVYSKTARLLILAFLLLQFVLADHTARAETAAPLRHDMDEEAIARLIDEHRKAGDIPGLAVVIADGQTELYSGFFGYANVEGQIPVTGDTLFELGSNSKAFTALAIVKLFHEGLIHYSDPVDKYLPWLRMTYKGAETAITIEQLMHHTSGIPFHSIKAIPASGASDALEQTVRTLQGQRLVHEPGSKYLYATINYDVLGLIIQTVTGTAFESYMQEQLLTPLGLTDVYMLQEHVEASKMATGYKYGFGSPRRYDAPTYKGNLPAGYFITNAHGLLRWMQLQLQGGAGSLAPYGDYIEKTHQPNRTVAPDGAGASYGGGWSIFQRGTGEISHGGANPNFSSFIILRPADQLAIGVMANINSSYTESLAQNILNQILGQELDIVARDQNKSVDKLSTALFLLLGIVGVGLIYGILSLVVKAAASRGWQRQPGQLLKAIFYTVYLGIFIASIQFIPHVFFDKLDWAFLYVWGPLSLSAAAAALCIAGVLYYVFSIVQLFCTKSSTPPYHTLIVLSLLSGFGNALIIYTINEAIMRNEEQLVNGLLFYFLLALLIYILGQRMIRFRLVEITNELVYAKRLQLINRLLQTNYAKLEDIEHSHIQACLNNDTEKISNFATVIVTGATGLTTLMFCFAYLGSMNPYGLLLSVLVIALTAGLFFRVSQRANRLWELTRDTQNVFFGFIHDLLFGFKELRINKQKRDAFGQDMAESCKVYKTNRVKADLKFANVSIVGELLFVIVIGAVAFIFPYIFKRFEGDTIRSYVFVFIYMTGPLHAVLNTIPELIQMRISWKRIHAMLTDLAQPWRPSRLNEHDSVHPPTPFTSLEVQEVVYRYHDHNGNPFSIGPVNLQLNQGEITFITGGNGSGKSTLAKVLTGLYPPDEGQFIMNALPLASHEELGEYYATVYNDYHLFPKMYGVDMNQHGDQAKRLLQELQLSSKVNIVNGAFDTQDLSTGQRKRLALLACCLEDKPLILLDEWAADQDPQYKDYFYRVLLPKLKQAGKCIVAISHDDRYFDCADVVLKMESGHIVEIHRMERTQNSVRG